MAATCADYCPRADKSLRNPKAESFPLLNIARHESFSVSQVTRAKYLHISSPQTGSLSRVFFSKNGGLIEHKQSVKTRASGEGSGCCFAHQVLLLKLIGATRL